VAQAIAEDVACRYELIKERLMAAIKDLPSAGWLMILALRALVMAAALVACAPLEAAALNVVAIGASNTSGWGVGAQSAYPAQLQALLRKKGINANVANAGVPGDVTSGMLSRLDAAVPKGTDIVILQPGANDLRFFGTKERRAANIAAMVKLMRARGIRVIVYDPEKIPADFYQWDGIHFNAAAHAKIAATLAAQIAASAKPQPPTAPSPPQTAPSKP
jgi:acyl-CoA thioesterase-1